MAVPTPRPRLAPSPRDADAALLRVGSTPCRLEVWTDREYRDRKDSLRPAAAEHREGLGWIVALPIDSNN